MVPFLVTCYFSGGVVTVCILCVDDVLCVCVCFFGGVLVLGTTTNFFGKEQVGMF